MLTEKIKKNLDGINYLAAQAADKSGRTINDITLVAVTKTVEPDIINSLVSLGVRELGENRPQELNRKIPLVQGCSWHLIGNLQKNKIKYTAGKVSLIQSVDSAELAAAIDAYAEKAGVSTDILLEINISGEPSKHGIPPQDALRISQNICRLNNIRLRGFMTVAPFVENGHENRDYFKKMRNLYVDIREKLGNIKDISILSMGMTCDYVTAIEEGATMVRIGTGIFNLK